MQRLYTKPRMIVGAQRAVPCLVHAGMRTRARHAEPLRKTIATQHHKDLSILLFTTASCAK